MRQRQWGFLSCEMATHTVTLKTAMNKGAAAYVPSNLNGPDSGSLGRQTARPVHSGPMKGLEQPLGPGFRTGRNFSLEFVIFCEKKAIHQVLSGYVTLSTLMCNYLLYNSSQFAGLRIHRRGVLRLIQIYALCINLSC